MLQVWNYFNHQGHLFLGIQRLWTFMNAFETFQKLQGVVKCYDWVLGDVVCVSLV